MYHIKNNDFYCEEVLLKDLATKYKTPFYVYSLNKLKQNLEAIKKPFLDNFPNGMICYAIKANSNLTFLKYLSQNGCGFDAVSGGELERVYTIQKHLNNVVYSGTTKSYEELEKAILYDIFMINCESISEIKHIAEISQKHNKKVRLAIRVNPAVSPKTHPNIDTGNKGAKFGIAMDHFLEAALLIKSSELLSLQGISCHIGSMVENEVYYFEMLNQLVDLLELLKKHDIFISHLDMGGGYAIQYTQENTINFEKLFTHYKKVLEPYNLIPIIEPGRSIIGNVGALVAKAVYTKQQNNRNFMFLDAGMTELIRPALYNAIHKIVAITHSSPLSVSYTIGGPICESSDIFRDNAELYATEGDLILIENAGAYGYSMASNYNTRPKAPEILIDGSKDLLINKREEISDLWKTEIIHDL